MPITIRRLTISAPGPVGRGVFAALVGVALVVCLAVALAAAVDHQDSAAGQGQPTTIVPRSQDLALLLSMVHTATCQVTPGVDDEESGCVELRAQITAAYVSTRLADRRQVMKDAALVTRQAIHDFKARKPRSKLPREMEALLTAFERRAKE